MQRSRSNSPYRQKCIWPSQLPLGRGLGPSLVGSELWAKAKSEGWAWDRNSQDGAEAGNSGKSWLLRPHVPSHRHGRSLQKMLANGCFLTPSPAEPCSGQRNTRPGSRAPSAKGFTKQPASPATALCLPALLISRRRQGRLGLIKEIGTCGRESTNHRQPPIETLSPEGGWANS